MGREGAGGSREKHTQMGRQTSRWTASLWDSGTRSPATLRSCESLGDPTLAGSRSEVSGWHCCAIVFQIHITVSLCSALRDVGFLFKANSRSRCPLAQPRACGLLLRGHVFCSSLSWGVPGGLQGHVLPTAQFLGPGLQHEVCSTTDGH